MIFERSSKGRIIAVPAGLIAVISCVWFCVQPLEGFTRVFLIGWSLMFAAFSFLAFQNRNGRFFMEGNRCVWDTALLKRHEHVLDFAEVTELTYQDRDSSSYSFFAILRDGSKVNLPPGYLHRARDIAQFMDFVKKTQPHVRIVGRDLLPRS